MQGRRASAMPANGIGQVQGQAPDRGAWRGTFEDVAGVDEAKEDLQEIVEFLARDPQRFQKLGGRIPRRRVAGRPAPGTARRCWRAPSQAMKPMYPSSRFRVRISWKCSSASVRAGRPRHVCAGQEEFALHHFYRRDRRRWQTPWAPRPWRRGNDEARANLDQLLVEMDGFEANESIILIAATNRPDVLDSGAYAPRPLCIARSSCRTRDIVGRERISKCHVRKVPLPRRMSS